MTSPVYVLDDGTHWTMGPTEDGDFELRWTYEVPEGVVEHKITWNSVDDVPLDFNPEEAVRKRKKSLHDTTMMVGHHQIIKRRSIGNLRIYLYIDKGPPTWWVPKFTLRHKGEFTIGAGWLQRGVMLTLERVKA